MDKLISLEAVSATEAGAIIGEKVGNPDAAVGIDGLRRIMRSKQDSHA